MVGVRRGGKSRGQALVVFSVAVKLYLFDGVNEDLELLPLAARRALDRAGLKLSLEAWQSLPSSERRNIAEAGSGANVELEPVQLAISIADPPAKRLDPVDDPPADAPPAALVDALGPERALPRALWAALSPLDRYVLAKVASRGRPGRLQKAYSEIIGHSAGSTHVAPAGGVRMVDVKQKSPSERRAVAESLVTMSREALGRLQLHDVPKGDVLSTARVAGIMAAKRTADLIPLCHPVALTHVTIDLEVDEAARAVRVQSAVETLDRTGVEMEALVAASIAALTIYDMLKAFDRAMEIGPTRLVEKSGGRSGEYRR